MQVDQRKILYKLEDQENQNRRQNLRIHALPEERGEDLRKGGRGKKYFARTNSNYPQ